MITRYKDFLKENKSTSEGITEEEYFLLKKYEIKNYRFNDETKLIDVDQNVNLNEKNLISLPNIRFGTINGGFYCNRNNLTSLDYCPLIVKGNFSCSYNQLYSLENCPKIENGNFYCGNNKLTSLDYCPQIVNGDFWCNVNKLSSIEDYPLSWIKGDISDIFEFEKILNLVKSKPEVYKPLIELGDKIKFHQQVMRDDLSLISKYSTILPPSKKTLI